MADRRLDNAQELWSLNSKLKRDLKFKPAGIVNHCDEETLDCFATLLYWNDRSWCHTRGEYQGTYNMYASASEGIKLWNPEETSPEVQNMYISGRTKKDLCPPKKFKIIKTEIEFLWNWPDIQIVAQYRCWPCHTWHIIESMTLTPGIQFGGWTSNKMAKNKVAASMLDWCVNNKRITGEKAWKWKHNCIFKRNTGRERLIRTRLIQSST